MALSRDEIMRDLAGRVDEIINKQLSEDSAIFWGANKHQDDTWCWVLMVEAHKAGNDPVMAKAAYLRGDVDAVPTDDRIDRLAKAIAYAGVWEAR